MNARSASTTRSQHVAPRVAKACSKYCRDYSGLLGSLGFVALLLVCAPALAAVALGNAQSFAVLGGSSVTFAGTGTFVTGDVGVAPGTSITGIPAAATVNPPFGVHNDDASAIAAQASTGALYTSLVPGSCPSPSLAQLSGATFTPGTYCFASTADLASNGVLTLNGAGTYIFQVGSGLTANVGSHVVLTGVDPCTVFWQVTSAAVLNGVNFPGTVVAQAGVTLGVGATLDGRALTTTAGSVTMSGTNTVGGCSAPVPAPGGVALGKAFLPAVINAGGVSILNITLSNNNLGVATLSVPLTDTLPGGMVVAPTPNASTTCGSGGSGGGVVSATAGANTVSLSTNSTIPGGTPGTCTMTVSVTAPGPGSSYLNTLAACALSVAITGGGSACNAAASATLILIPGSIGIPTLSEWAMIMLAALLAIAGFAAMRRRAR